MSVNLVPYRRSERLHAPAEVEATLYLPLQQIRAHEERVFTLRPRFRFRGEHLVAGPIDSPIVAQQVAENFHVHDVRVGLSSQLVEPAMLERCACSPNERFLHWVFWKRLTMAVASSTEPIVLRVCNTSSRQREFEAWIVGRHLFD